MPSPAPFPPSPHPRRGQGSSSFGPRWGGHQPTQAAPWAGGFSQRADQPRHGAPMDLPPPSAQQPRPPFPPPQAPTQWQQFPPPQQFPPSQRAPQWQGQRPPQQPMPGQWQQASQQTWQVPPAPRRSSKGGSKWWLLLPFLVLGLMIGYMMLSRDVPQPPPNVPAVEEGYVNEDYAVPAVGTGPTEIEDSLGDPTVLTSNAIYNQPVAVPVRCEPPAVTDVDDKLQLQARMTNLSECLTKTFGPALEEAGYIAYQPRVLVYDTNGTTPCGELEPVGAFYCGANQGIYLSSDLSLLAGPDIVGIDYVMAHEYAHNLQGRTGILVQRIHEHRSAVGVAEENEVNRRLETQADCLAGSFFKSAADSVGYTDSDKSYIVDIARSVGDDQFLPPEDLPSTHGTSDSRERWVKRGFAAAEYGECNTFVAPLDEVE